MFHVVPIVITHKNSYRKYRKKNEAKLDMSLLTAWQRAC